MECTGQDTEGRVRHLGHHHSSQHHDEQMGLKHRHGLHLPGSVVMLESHMAGPHAS